MAVGRRLGAGLLRLGGFALSCLAYSYLELLDIRGQQGPNATGSGGRLSSLIVETLGEYAPAAAAKWGEGAAAVPPILKRLWLNHLPFLLLLLVLPALVLPGTTLLGVNAIYFYGCLVAAALREPHAPNDAMAEEGSGGGWTSVVTLGLFAASALVYWLEPGGGSVHSEDRVRFRPFEAEIRQLLLKHDPSKLHLVDGWLQAHRWNPRKLYRDLQAQYESAAPIQQPAPAATATAARPRSARSTATTASAASVSPPGAAIHRRRGASPPVGPSVPAGPVAMAGGGARDVYGGGREAYGGYAAAGQRRRQGAYGAYDDEEEEEEEEGDEGSVYHDAAAGPYSRGEEKASASSYHYQGRGVGGGGGIVRGSAVSAVMAATRDYQEGILARQQDRLRSLHVSSPPRNNNNRHGGSYSQPAGSPGRHGATHYQQQQPGRYAYSQR